MEDHPILGAALFAIGAVLVAANPFFSDISSPSTAFFSLSGGAAN
jgi:hypothetical protein